MQWRNTDAAVSADYRGYALAEFGQHIRVCQQRAIIVRVHVNKPWCQYSLPGIDFLFTAAIVERTDSADTISLYSDIGQDSIGATTIDEAGLADNEIEFFLSGHMVHI